MDQFLSSTVLDALICALLVINIFYLAKYIKLRIEEKKDKSEILIRENERLHDLIMEFQKVVDPYDPDILISADQNTFISQHLRDVDAKDFIKTFGFQTYVCMMIRAFQLLNKSTRSTTWIRVGDKEFRLENSDKVVNDASSPSLQ